VAAELECPVCLLIPRQPPIFLCPAGHLICRECRPKVTRCPVCKVHYLKARHTRNYFAEKVLESVSRRCRFELFGCDFAFTSSRALVAHERHHCALRPRQGAAEVGEEEEEEEPEPDEDEFAQNQEDQDPNNAMLLNLVSIYDTRPFLHYYAVTVVLLRAAIHHSGDPRRGGAWAEGLLLLLAWAWLLASTSAAFRRFLDIYQPDEFAAQFAVLRGHLRRLLYQDASSLYTGLLVWALAVLSALHHAKAAVRASADQEEAAARHQAVMFFVKPAVTLGTAVVCTACHLAAAWQALDRWAALLGVFRLLWLAGNLAFVELVLATGEAMDQGYTLIFWLQALLVHLPHGKVSFILLEMFGFIILLYNAFDTLVLAGEHRADFLATFHRAFLPGRLEGERRALALRRQVAELATSLAELGETDAEQLFKAGQGGRETLKLYLKKFYEEL